MDNQKVRAHLRKGELAVQQMEDMGFTYSTTGAPKWVAPKSFVSTVEALKEIQAVLDKFSPQPTPPQPTPPNACPVLHGAFFKVTSLPSGHYLGAYSYSYMVFRVVSTEWIEKDSMKSMRLNGYTGWVVHFRYDKGFDVPTKGLWLPLSCIKVVTSNADF